MKQKEKQRQLKQRFTKKNIAILSTAITVCIVAAIAIPLCVLSVQTLPVSNEMPETFSYSITETLSEENVESIESVADSCSQQENSEHSESIQEQPSQNAVEQKFSTEERTKKYSLVIICTLKTQYLLLAHHRDIPYIPAKNVVAAIPILMLLHNMTMENIFVFIATNLTQLWTLTIP